MSNPALTRLLREWAALVAVLALVLGPLASGISRSLGTTDQIAIASGAKPFALCMPGGEGADPAGGPDCNHCTAAMGFFLTGPVLAKSESLDVGLAMATDDSSKLRPFPRAPPARGTPAA
jgi:hypothetical protein